MRLRMRGLRTLGSGIATAYPVAGCRSGDVEAEVERARGVRQPAERDRVDAGFGNRANVGERDATRRLEVAGMVDARHGAPHLLGRHVVEEHGGHAARERLVELPERVDLDLD